MPDSVIVVNFRFGKLIIIFILWYFPLISIMQSHFSIYVDVKTFKDVSILRRQQNEWQMEMIRYARMEKCCNWWFSCMNHIFVSFFILLLFAIFWKYYTILLNLGLTTSQEYGQNTLSYPSNCIDATQSIKKIELNYILALNKADPAIKSNISLEFLRNHYFRIK